MLAESGFSEDHPFKLEIEANSDDCMKAKILKN
jgi:hypothetical protein